METIQCWLLLSIGILFLFDEISCRHSGQQNITSTEETEHLTWSLMNWSRKKFQIKFTDLQWEVNIKFIIWRIRKTTHPERLRYLSKWITDPWMNKNQKSDSNQGFETGTWEKQDVGSQVCYSFYTSCYTFNLYCLTFPNWIYSFKVYWG